MPWSCLSSPQCLLTRKCTFAFLTKASVALPTASLKRKHDVTSHEVGECVASSIVLVGLLPCAWAVSSSFQSQQHRPYRLLYPCPVLGPRAPILVFILCLIGNSAIDLNFPGFPTCLPTRSHQNFCCVWPGALAFHLVLQFFHFVSVFARHLSPSVGSSDSAVNPCFFCGLLDLFSWFWCIPAMFSHIFYFL